MGIKIEVSNKCKYFFQEHSNFVYTDKSCVQAAAPSCTELETIVLDWLGKMIGKLDNHTNKIL